MRRLILWGVGLVFIGVLVAVAFVRGSGITAMREPWPLEERVARAGWRFMIPRETREATNPVPSSAQVIEDGLEHFADHCAVCHSNDGSGDTAIGRRIFPRAPDLRAEGTQRLSDGELFYAIERGIPWTAMPAWETGTPEGAEESWKLVRFIRHLPALTPEELTAMEKLNPKSAAETARDREIDEFLKGKGAGPAAPIKGGTSTNRAGGFSTAGGDDLTPGLTQQIARLAFRGSTLFRGWPGSCSRSVGVSMFRTAAFSLILALAAGPNVSWVCTVLCDEAPVASDCQHQTPAASVLSAANSCCGIAAPNVAGFLPRDIRHSGVSFDSDSSSLVLRSAFDDSLTEDHQDTGESPGSARNLASLSVSLRL